jgi:hypothetical protein
MSTTVESRAGAVRLYGQVVARGDLHAATREAMFHLLSAHFRGADRDTFEADLAEKDYAILLEEADGTLRGFSTLLFYTSRAAGRALPIVYSGDTIVDRGAWGSPALARTWISAVREIGGVPQGAELYWFLLTSGYRTYRFLPVFFQSFYPRHDGAGADALEPMLDGIAVEKFGERYDGTQRIVRFASAQVLTPDLLALPEARTVDPHIAYFLQRNPGHERGDELACLTPIHDGNLTAAGRRMLREPQDR